LIDEIGRVVVKTRGREAGRKCVIVDTAGEGMVVVSGPESLTGVRRRRVNIAHVAFTPKKLGIKKGASDEEVLEAIARDGLEEYMKRRVEVRRWGTS